MLAAPVQALGTARVSAVDLAVRAMRLLETALCWRRSSSRALARIGMRDVKPLPLSPDRLPAFVLHGVRSTPAKHSALQTLLSLLWRQTAKV